MIVQYGVIHLVTGLSPCFFSIFGNRRKRDAHIVFLIFYFDWKVDIIGTWSLRNPIQFSLCDMKGPLVFHIVVLA